MILLMLFASSSTMDWWVLWFYANTFSSQSGHAWMEYQSFNKAKDFVWRHDLFEDSMVAAGLSGIESGTKLYISNLHYGVTREDIQVAGTSSSYYDIWQSRSCSAFLKLMFVYQQYCFRSFFQKWVIWSTVLFTTTIIDTQPWVSLKLAWFFFCDMLHTKHIVFWYNF